MGQHYIVSCGDRLNLLRDYCRLSGIDFIGGGTAS